MTKDSTIINLPALAQTKHSPALTSLNLVQKSAAAKIITESSSGKRTPLSEQVQKKYAGLDLILCGDLTGSMSAYHTLLKCKMKELCQNLFGLITNLKIGIIFYLDHGSGDPYITTVCQPTTNTQKLISFIEDTPTGYGGDEDEAVEDALHDILETISWRAGHHRSVVLFGDASCHPVSQCPYQHDFFTITRKLYEKQVTLNTVYCSDCADLQSVKPAAYGDFSEHFEYLHSQSFFSWLANVTGGMAISVSRIDELTDIILAAAAKDAGRLDELEKRFAKEPARLKLIAVAKKAESRKLEAMSHRLMIEAR